jgi:hypothetical protein
LNLKAAREHADRHIIRHALARSEGNISSTAKLLGISRRRFTICCASMICRGECCTVKCGKALIGVKFDPYGVKKGA